MMKISSRDLIRQFLFQIAKQIDIAKETQDLWHLQAMKKLYRQVSSLLDKDVS